MKMPFTENLPVQAVLPEFRQALKSHNQIILSAAPGAGKTTLIPPVCAEELSGNIRLIEPRRVAARAAACRIAELNDTPVGTFSGYAVRGESRCGEGTRILSVTPGILIREFQSDPLLEGVDAVIFDEFHERSWECDLLLTLALEIQSALRPELKIIIMSATLAAERLKNFLPEAAVINSSGREYPVEIVYKAPENPQAFDSIVLSCVRAAAELFRAQDTGDILVFLPGAGEISRSAAALREILKEADIRELHGALEFREQNKVLQKSAEGRRRIFLATNLAESSITIDGVTAVVDSGWEKRMTYSPASGMSFLELQRISRASAIQRAGRAGRTAPGKAVRLFSLIDYNNFPEQAPPEISVCDLTQLALNLADWGAVPADLRWLDAPPVPGMELSWKLLQKLGALTEENRPTAHGRALNKLPLHPRLGSMLLRAKEENLKSTACAIAALLENRTAGRYGADIRPLLEEMKYHPERWGARKTVMKQLLHLLGGPADEIEPEMAGRLLSWAYPEWIGQKRDGNTASYRLAGGRAGELDPKDPLFGEEFLSVAVLGGTSGKSVMIRLAAPLDRATLEKDFGSRLTRENVFDFDAETERVTAREELKLDALVLSSRAIPPPLGAAGKAVLAAAVKRKLLLPPENFKKARQLIDRVRFAGLSDPEAGFPDWSDEKWPEVLTDMTAGYLENVRSISDLLKLDWDHIVSGALPYEQLTMLEKLYPEFFTTPRGYRIRIDYSGENPAAAVRIQELYGVTVHPVIGRSHIPLRLELLSPARRPVQITMDLPGFWKGSWSLVRKDMRGRYPKHDWPEHPENEK